MGKGTNDTDKSLTELRKLGIDACLNEIVVLRSLLNDLLGDPALLEEPHPNESFDTRVRSKLGIE